MSDGHELIVVLDHYRILSNICHSHGFWLHILIKHVASVTLAYVLKIRPWQPAQFALLLDNFWSIGRPWSMQKQWIINYILYYYYIAHTTCILLSENFQIIVAFQDSSITLPLTIQKPLSGVFLPNKIQYTGCKVIYFPLNNIEWIYYNPPPPNTHLSLFIQFFWQHKPPPPSQCCQLLICDTNQLVAHMVSLPTFGISIGATQVRFPLATPPIKPADLSNIVSPFIQWISQIHNQNNINLPFLNIFQIFISFKCCIYLLTVWYNLNNNKKVLLIKCLERICPKRRFKE